MLKRRIDEVLTSDMISISPESPVSEALDLMRQKRISCIPVLEGDHPVGIFTERNVVQHLAHTKGLPVDHPIREFMSSPVLTAQSDMYIYEAFHVLTTRRIRHMIVVDEQNRAVGVVTQSDLVEHLAYNDFLEIKKISQVMTRDVYIVPRDESVWQVLVRMAADSISCVVVAEDRCPLGILTERDVARIASVWPDIRAVKVSEVMSSPPVVVSMDTPAYEAVCIMLHKSIRRLIVVGQDGRIEGLTTQSDIVRGLESKYVDLLRQVIREKNAVLQDTLKDLYTKTVYLDNILRSSIDMGIVATDLDHRVVYYNPSAEEITGLAARDAVGRDVRDLHRDRVDPERFSRVIDRVRRNSRHTFTFERDNNGRKQFIHARISGIWDQEQKLLGFVLMLRDISERKKAEETIRFLAYHDSLTGLPNRELFNDRLTHELAHAERNRHNLAVMVLDIDRFKEINDTWGHQTGDALLKQLAVRLKSSLRRNDTVARMGGDEFMIILPRIQEAEHAVYVAEKILRIMSKPFEIDGREMRATASIGISIRPLHSEAADTLIKIADDAMYHAKAQNRINGSSNLSLYPLP